ncbi:hypothetical protein GQ44DRAFT_825556 [Phaeosphaeriaceae sp. PMI808]|nr:hypothetical protein GQ44DRAFT_825556 [Phaeosphaeriaceae sp. PMI808]
MPPSTRIPPLLQPCIQLPHHDSLLLLTSTLGASVNWLLTRFLCDALSNGREDGEEHGHNVVLVSWMREYEFWKNEARKGAGLDLKKLERERKFTFVDGLSELCLDTNNVQMGGRIAAPGTISGLSTQKEPSALPSTRILPTRGPPQTSSTSRDPLGPYTLKSLDIAHLKSTVSSAVSSLTYVSTSTNYRKTLIILDNPDILLALDPTLNLSALTSLISTLHSLPNVSHILSHIQSDSPLLSLSSPPQLLEVAHRNFLIKLAHMSGRILGVRVLDTGVARDISGVIRVTEQTSNWMSLGLGDEEKEKMYVDKREQGKEFLYQVKGDGSVRVFERGAGGEG